MKIRAAWLQKLVGLAGAGLIRLWMGTLRYRVVYTDGVRHPADFRKQRYVYAFWHETILFPATFPTRIHVLISQHADGELIAQVCRFLGFGTTRGSTTRGGARALLELHRHSKKTHLAVTPDGPRGPRRQVQAGIVYLASVTGLPVVAVGIGYSAAWRARSWDRFAIPKPWSLAVSVVAPPVHVPRRLGRDGLEQYRQLIEERMAAVTAEAERRAGNAPRPALDAEVRIGA